MKSPQEAAYIPTPTEAEYRAHLSGKDEGVVIPFHLIKTGLWAAQREWMQTSRPLQQLANHVAEELDRAKRDLKAVEAALHAPHST